MLSIICSFPFFLVEILDFFRWYRRFMLFKQLFFILSNY